MVWEMTAKFFAEPTMSGESQKWRLPDMPSV